MSEVSLEPIGLADEHTVDQLLDRLTTYSMRVDGVLKKENGARHLLTAGPPGYPSATKHVFIVMHGGEPVGLIDVIHGYPRAGVAFIGLLAIAEDRHGQGLGRAAYGLLENFARIRLRASTMRLVIVDANPVEEFWRRMGFERTGEVRRYTGEAVTANAIPMQKQLSDHVV